MRRFMLLLLAFIALTNVCAAQEVGSRPSASNGESESRNTYIVQLTEFRMRRAADAKLTPSEIIKSFDEMKDDGDIEVIETIRLYALAGHECMVQIGRDATVTVGMSNTPGRSSVRQTAQQMVGTLVRLTAGPSDGKTRIALSYESSRFEGELHGVTPPDIKTFHVSTVLLVDPNTTVLAGGSSAGGTTFLAVSVK